MSLIILQNLRDWFAVPSEVKDARLELCIGAASRTLRSWVTDAVYQATGDDDQTADLQTAEANLAMYHLLLNTGVRIRQTGIVKKELDKSSASDSVTNEYLSSEELQTLRQEYFAAAENAALKYRPQASSARHAATTLTLPGGGLAKWYVEEV